MRPGASHPLRRWRGAIAAAAILLAPCAARAQAETPAAGGALAVSADPAQLVLGRDPGAELRIAAPPEVTELALTASAGRVEGVRRLPAGGFTARYHAPAERYPQVAIVAAVGHAGAAVLDGWLAIPLSGQGDARVRGAPGSDVSLRIGDRSFGPARAGDDGVAVIPVVVPPGVREGHQGFTAVDLHVPETSLVHAALDRAAGQADRPETFRVLACVVAPHGAARRGDAPVVEVSRGTAALRPREPGAFEGTWTLPPGPAGEERLTVRLDGSPASRAVLRVTTSPGPAASVAIAFDRAALTAGGEPVGITARALDAAGNAAAGAVVLSADAGALTQEQAGAGAVRGSLAAGPRFGGRGQIVIRARALATGAAGEAALPLQAAAPVAAALRPRNAYTSSDGGADATLTLELRDGFGNLAAGTPRVTASAGPAPRLEPLERGRWAVRWRPEPGEAGPPVALEASLGAARAAARVWPMPPPRRQAALLAGGGVLRAGGAGGAAFLGGAELPLPDALGLAPQRALALRLELIGGARRQDGRPARTAAFLAGPALRGLLPPVRWFASATAGALWGSVDRAGGGASTGVAPALRLGAGLAAPVARTAPFLELSLLASGRTPAGPSPTVMLTFGLRHDTARPAPAAQGE